MDTFPIVPAMLFVLAALVALSIWSLAIVFGAKTDVDRRMRLTRLLRIWLPTAALGVGGLAVAIMRYPDSNLLGGYALVFGPLWMVAGPVVLLLAVLKFLNRRASAQRTASHRAP